MKALFFSVLFLIIFLYYFFKKKELGLNVIIFTIPFSYSPFFSELIGKLFPISITGILVVFYYILTSSWRNFNTPNSFYKSLKYILVFFLLWGIVFAFVYYSDAQSLRHYIGSLTTQISTLKLSVQVLYHSSNLIICILFLKILKNHFQIKKNIYDATYVFSLTIIPIFLYQILEMTGNRYILYGLFVNSEKFVVDDPRYLSLFTIFGFGIYIAMVAVFSLYFKFKYYKITFISALLFGLFSGERQALLIPFIVLLIYYLFKKGFILKKLIYFIGISVATYVLLFVLKDEINGINRLWISIDMIQNNQVMLASGRDVEGIPFIIKALKDWPITGKGLYSWGYFKGIPSYYADHVVLFNLYQKFGLIGFLLFISATLYLLVSSIKRLIFNNNKELEAVILGLIISFIGMQLLDNFFWFTNTMLLYVLMFGIIFSLRSHEALENQTPKY